MHASVPLWSNGMRDDVSLLMKAIKSAFVLGGEIDCESLSLPHMTHDTHPFPDLICCKIMFQVIEDFALSIDLNDPEIDMPLKSIMIVIDDERLLDIYENEFLRRYSNLNMEFGNGGVINVIESAANKADKESKPAWADKKQRMEA